MSKYLKKLFENKDLVLKQGEKSRQLFEQNYTDKIYYNKIINIYKALVGEKKNV